MAELAGHRFERHQLAAKIEPILEDENQELRRLACIALRRLGSCAVASSLMDRLTDIDDDVAHEAWTSLCSLTGLDLPNDLHAWESALRPTP